MQLRLLFETIWYLKPGQLIFQIWDRLYKPKLKWEIAPKHREDVKIVDVISIPDCYKNGLFSFLNVTDVFRGWSDTSHGKLWTFNLNYMDWLRQDSINSEEGEKWIDRFIEDLSDNRVGLEPYPIALRVNNWIKFLVRYPECATAERLKALYSQVKLLSRKLEYKLMGNHLLEDAFALFVASIYFNDNKLYKKASKLLKGQLKEQVLPDGAHFEQSPMYHCILLDRLLDCINFASNSDDEDYKGFLKDIAIKMLGHLESIIWEDGSIPLLNDSALGIAPTAEQIFDYARRLGLAWKPVPLKECGYRKLKRGVFEAIVDVGNITASYQPAHSHADTFNYELRVNGQPFIVDSGISTYEDNGDRHYERSTKAHNTVSVKDKDSSHVWRTFRVGKRAKIKLIKDTPDVIIAEHDGFGRNCTHRRLFNFDNEGNLCIEDFVASKTEAISYIHLAPGIKASKDELQSIFIYMDELPIALEGATGVEILKQKVSTIYNQKEDADVFAISFKGYLKYTISGIA